MLIKKIRMNGFKNISNTLIKFSDVTALVSLNNYGKSNILDCMEFSEKFIKANNKLKTKMMSDPDRLPINKKIANSDFSFEIEFETVLNKNKYEVEYMYCFEWIKDIESKGKRVKKEVLKVKNLDKGTKPQYSKYIERTLEKATYRSTAEGRSKIEIDIPQNELLINKLLNNSDLFYIDIIREINELNFDTNVYMDTDDVFRTIGINSEKVYDPTCLDQKNGCNLAQVVHYLRENYIEKYEMLINSFKILIPNIEEIEPLCLDLKKDVPDKSNIKKLPFKIPEKIYDIRIKENYNNQSTSFHNLSSGSKRIFLLLTSAILSEINNVSLIAFEELENSIHPYLFQRFIIILTQIVKNCRILVTSHSPYLIQYLNLEKIYIGLPSKEGVAQFKKIKRQFEKNIYKIATEEELSIGDYIFDLLLDSYSDNTILKSYME